MTTDIAAVIERLYDLRTWRAFDIDADGRVLAGNDELGSVQLVEIDTGRHPDPLTALPVALLRAATSPAAAGRGRSTTHGGDERMQLRARPGAVRRDARSTLDGADAARPRPGATCTCCCDVTPEHLVVYDTNRRNAVDFDVVVRDLGTGPRRPVYDGGGYVAETRRLPRPRARSRSPAQPAARVHAGLRDRSGGRAGGGATSPPPTSTPSTTCGGWTPTTSPRRRVQPRPRVHRHRPGIALDGRRWTTLVEDDAHDLEVLALPGRLGHGRRPARRRRRRARRARDRRRTPLPSILPAAGADGRLGRRLQSRFVLTVLRRRRRRARSTPSTRHRRGDAPSSTRARRRSRRRSPPARRAHRRTASPTPTASRSRASSTRPHPTRLPGLAGASVLFVHGGPEAAATRIFNPVVQALTAAGFTVLVPNVRGSAGYGKRWFSLDDVDLRLDSVADLAALHAWLPELGLDPARIGTVGRFVRRLHGAGRHHDAARPVGGRRRHRRHVLARHLPREHLRLPPRRTASASTAASSTTATSSSRASPDHLPRPAPRAAVRHPRRQRPPRPAVRGRADRRGARRTRGIPHELRVYADEGHGLAKRANRKDAYPAAIDFLRQHLVG